MAKGRKKSKRPYSGPMTKVYYPGMSNKESAWMNSNGQVGVSPYTGKRGPGPRGKPGKGKGHVTKVPGRPYEKPTMIAEPDRSDPKYGDPNWDFNTSTGEFVPKSSTSVTVNKVKPSAGQQFEKRMGPIKQTKAQEGEVEFGREQKQALVDRLKKYEYGKNKGAAQKDFYGGDYKRGTVKKLNKKIAAGKELTGKAQKELESLSQQATATGDPNAQKQLEARKQSLSETYGKQQSALKQSEGERQKFLNLRNKRLKTIFTNMKANPRAVEADRRRKTRKKYRELSS